MADYYQLEAKEELTNITLDKLRSARRNLEPILRKISENYKYNLTDDELEKTQWATELVKGVGPPENALTDLEILKDYSVKGTTIQELVYVLGDFINKIAKGHQLNSQKLGDKNKGSRKSYQKSIAKGSIFGNLINFILGTACNKQFEICIIIKTSEKAEKNHFCEDVGDNDCGETCGNVKICVDKGSKYDQRNEEIEPQENVAIFDPDDQPQNLLKFNEYGSRIIGRDISSKTIIENFIMQFDEDLQTDGLLFGGELQSFRERNENNFEVYKTRDFYDFYEKIGYSSLAFSDLRLRNKANCIDLHEKYEDLKSMNLNYNLNFPWIVPFDELRSALHPNKRILCCQYVRYNYRATYSSSKASLRTTKYYKQQLICLRKEYSVLEQLSKFCKNLPPLVMNHSLHSLKIRRSKGRAFNCYRKCKINDAVYAILECLHEFQTVRRFLNRQKRKYQIS